MSDNGKSLALHEAFEREKALKAQVERLREAAQNTVEDLRARARTGCDGVKTVNVSDWVFQELKGSIAETPAQSLREIRAEAGREGYLAGMARATRNELPPDSRSRGRIADAYAQQIRSGER